MNVFKKKDPNVRQMNLSNEDIAELSFYTRRMKEIEIDLFLWQDAVKRIKASITSRLAVSKEEIVNWDHVFIDGKVIIMKIPAPQPQTTPEPVNKQEVNKDGERK